MDACKTGALIRAERAKKNWTQPQLAELLHVTAAAVCKWETGKNMPDAENLQAISKLLDIPVTDLLNGERRTPDSEVHTPPPTSVKKRLSTQTLVWLSVSAAAVAALSLALFFYYTWKSSFHVTESFYGDSRGLSTWENAYCVIVECPDSATQNDIAEYAYSIAPQYQHYLENTEQLVILFFRDYDAQLDYSGDIPMDFYVVILPYYFLY